MTDVRERREAQDGRADALYPVTAGEGSDTDTDADDDRPLPDVTTGQVPVAVYGLGKMGLPLAAAMADATGNVVGVDLDESVVETVNGGGCHIVNESGLPELVADQVDRGRLRATTDGERAAADSTVHVVIVPTLLEAGEAPDLSNVRAVVRQIATGLDPGDVVFIESTVPPGTSRDVVEPLLASESGLDTDQFGVAFCPERTSSGRALEDITGAYPKVVGGTDDRATRAARHFYEALTTNEVIPVTDATTAESVKVFEGVYRDVNIALANELGRLSSSLGVDAREAIAVANTQPFCEIHDPGPGVGGHCIPFYPHFLIHQASTQTPLLWTARNVNESMPGYTAGLMADLLEAEGQSIDGADVVLFGATYRPEVAETTHTPTRPVANHLTRLGASVHVVDPLLDAHELAEFPGTPLALDEVPDLDPDAVVVVTPHAAFEEFDWEVLSDAVILDARDGIDALDGVPTIGGGVL